jgi:acyl dehydratase
MAPEGYSTRTLRDFIGHDFGASAPIAVDQERINTFADVTGDHQWIHVDVERARKMSPFGGPVAHGFLTLALLAAAVGAAGVVPADAKGVVNYGPRQDPLHCAGPGRRSGERQLQARRGRG